MSPMDCGRRTEGLRLYQFIIIIYHSFIAVDKVEREENLSGCHAVSASAQHALD